MNIDELEKAMRSLRVKIKKLHPDAVIPSYAKAGDAGMDLVAISDNVDDFVLGNVPYIEYGTGLAIELPKGHVGLIYSRSSVSKQSLTLCNSTGVLDEGFRGELKLRFYTINSNDFHPRLYGPGSKIGQLIIMPYPQVEFQEVDELSDTDRGDGGFGSTGK